MEPFLRDNCTGIRCNIETLEFFYRSRQLGELIVCMVLLQNKKDKRVTTWLEGTH